MQVLENGSTYAVASQRKGKFTGRLVSHSETWATLEITSGKAGAMLDCNEREKGEEVTVRRSLATLTKQERITIPPARPGTTEERKVKKPNPQAEADKFNASIPVGSLVEFRNLPSEEAKQYRTRTPAEVLSGHTAVVWLDGKSGCVCCSHCKLVEEEVQV